MKNILILLIILVLLAFPAFAASPVDFVTQELVPFLEDNDEAAILFGAELNISNGPPDARLYGERYMFGCLVMAEEMNAEDYLQDVDLIRDEAIRLLLNPNYSPDGSTGKRYGSTELSFHSFTDVMYLDYETGTWQHWPGEILALRIEHTTEYSGMTRYRCIAAEEPIKYAILWINWR